jgi:hypothetical protein
MLNWRSWSGRLHAVFDAGLLAFIFGVFYLFRNFLHPVIIVVIRPYNKNVVLDEFIKLCGFFNPSHL